MFIFTDYIFFFIFVIKLVCNNIKIISGMKKILLSVSVLGAALANAQTGITVAAGGSVHVQPRTMLYSEGTLSVSEDGNVVSDGHVHLIEGFTNDKEDGSNVRFLYTDGNAGPDSAYGQLIIDKNATIDGKISMETAVLKQQKGAGVEIAFPFASSGESIIDVINSATKSDGTGFGNNIQDIGDYQHRAVYYQKNKTHEVEIQDEVLKSPETLYSLFMDGSVGYGADFVVVSDGSGGDSRDVVFSGTPNVADINVQATDQQRLGMDESLILDNYEGLAWDKHLRNSHNHYYFTYLEDFVDNLSDGSWGHNIYGYGNPYTSNMDVTQLLDQSGIDVSDVRGIAIHGEESTDNTNNHASSSGKFYVSTCNESAVGLVDINNCAGDLIDTTVTNDLGHYVLRPFGTFWIKFKDGKSAHTMNYTQDVQTFGYGGLMQPKGDPFGSISDGNNSNPCLEDDSCDETVLSRSSKINKTKSDTNALEVLRLGVFEGDEKLDHVFIAANPIANNEFDEALDATKQSTAILSVLNEDLEDVNKHLHINGFNKTSYIGKPIKLSLNTKESGKEYTIKGAVRIGGDFNLDNQNFLLEDKRSKKIVRIGSDFEYKYKSGDNDSDRFIVYYKEVPVDIDEVIDEVIIDDVIVDGRKSSIEVASDTSGEYNIVFNQVMGKAKLYVYNVLGQLVYTDENVDTNHNYTLNKLPKNSGVYIVKIIDENGNVTSRKIVK